MKTFMFMVLLSISLSSYAERTSTANIVFTCNNGGDREFSQFYVILNEVFDTKLIGSPKKIENVQFEGVIESETSVMDFVKGQISYSIYGSLEEHGHYSMSLEFFKNKKRITDKIVVSNTERAMPYYNVYDLGHKLSATERSEKQVYHCTIGFVSLPHFLKAISQQNTHRLELKK